MRSKFSKIALVAILGIALAFTFSCSSDSGDDDSGGNSGIGTSSSNTIVQSSSSVSSSSSSEISYSSGGKEETYYLELGGVSVKADDLINSTPGITATDALKYLNQYPIVPDKYKSVYSGVSRAEVEELFDEFSVYVEGFSKEQALRKLDTNGQVLLTILNSFGDWIYTYVERE